MRTPARMTEARLALARRLAILRHDARALALDPSQFRPAAAATSQTWACRPVAMVWASRRISNPLVLTPPGFIQIDAESKIGRSAGRRQHPAER